MTTETLKHLHVPHDLGDPRVLLKFLTALGFDVPFAATRCAGAGTSLAASGFRISVPQIDAALAKYTAEPADRIGVKVQLGRAGLLAG